MSRAAFDLISKFRRAGFPVSLDEKGRVHVERNGNRLPPELLSELRATLPEVREYLELEAVLEAAHRDVSEAFDRSDRKSFRDDHDEEEEIGVAMRAGDLEQARRAIAAWREGWLLALSDGEGIERADP